MARKREQEKLIQLWVSPELAKRIDGAAATEGKSRSEWVRDACRSRLDGSPSAATGADLLALRLELKEGFSILAGKIDDQPVQVQALMAPQEDWKQKPLMDRLLKR